ncbi:hypothetical protein D2Q93_06370 [Alicyclobacillaceae bacterium I2511]|nr:hypothetical protein D2Q93_06370 [Alicyclobacillaceae bacterium I2511]
MPTDGFLFDLSAAQWREGITDEIALIEALAVRLEQALPNITIVHRSLPLFSKNKRVQSVSVKFEDAEYTVSQGKNGVHAEKGKLVRNVRLKTEQFSLSEWLDELSTALQAYAEQRAEARESLEKFLLGD